MPEDVHQKNLEAIKTARAALDQQPDRPGTKERKAELDKVIADAEKKHGRAKRGKTAPETTAHEAPAETAVPPGPISKRRQEQQKNA